MAVQIDRQRLARDVRAKRGKRSLRDIGQELGVGHNTIARLESGNYVNTFNLEVVLSWLGTNPADYFIVDNDDRNPFSVQLRAMQSMSTETASALMDVIRAVYEQILAEAGEETLE
jgi:DNA-binding XRE family transcriptional regulator